MTGEALTHSVALTNAVPVASERPPERGVKIQHGLRSEPDACIDCAKCAKACPSLLQVDRLITVTSAECTGCLECVTACPAQGALRLSVGCSRAIPTWAVVAVIAVFFFGLVGYAQITGNWHTAVPDQVYRELIPAANSLAHPQ